MLLSELRFGSYLTYCPRPNSEEAKKSKNLMYNLKSDSVLQDIGITTSEYIVNRLIKEMETLPFREFFNENVYLVPVPKSSMTKPGSLWVPERLVNMLSNKKMGTKSILLKRVKAVNKSATASSGNRPKAIDHFNSLIVIKGVHVPQQIVLVDDVVTRGATFLGCASRLKQSYPNAIIMGFAVLRTISDPNSFEKISNPCMGKITHSGDHTYRDP